MLVRREALESAGYFDERFFMYAEEIDLCRRIKAAGWEIRHLPQMTILHRVFKGGVSPKVESLVAVTRMMYARKHFSAGHRAVYGSAVMLRHVLRCVYSGSDDAARDKRAAARQVVATMLGRRPVPYAMITCPVAVLTGDRELRDAQMVTRHTTPARDLVGGREQ
jgi:hypothetical protein